MPHKKLIPFSNDQIVRIQKDANDREISFTEMVRRILDRYYEDQPQTDQIVTKSSPRPGLTFDQIALKPQPRPGLTLNEGLLPQKRPR